MADDTEEKNRAIASELIDLFLPDDKGLTDAQVAQLEADNEPKILAILAKLDGVTAAAVVLNMAFELEPEDISEFLALLEGTSGDEEEGEEDDDN